ncbi:MAG: hypothetical protein L6R36_002864 [Xanthoria steineri]|nr:MAG: hypothetical protein L6R36_002864 [Xanthoria steineri]
MSLSSPQKVVLITGSSQGLGRAIAIKFAQASTHLIVCADLHPGRKPPTHVYTPPRLQDPSNLEDTAGAAPKYQDDRPPHTSSAGPSNPSSNSPILHSGLKDHDGDDDPEIPTHELICERYGERKAIYIQCDVSKEEGKGGMQGAIEEAIREGGKLIVYEFFLLHLLPPENLPAVFTPINCSSPALFFRCLTVLNQTRQEWRENKVDSGTRAKERHVGETTPKKTAGRSSLAQNIS